MESNPENVDTSSSNEGKDFIVEPLRLSEEGEFNNPTVESCGPHSFGRYIEVQDDNFKDKSVKERERCETSPHGLARLCSMSLRRDDNSPNKTGSHEVFASEPSISLPVDQPTSAQCNDYLSSFPSDEMSEDTVGSVETPGKCDICSEILKSEISLKRHIVFHSEQRTCYKCTKCGDVFASKTGLSCHGKTHKDHPFERCDECGKIFSSVCTSHSHKSSHHGEHSKKGNCNICDKKVFNLYHHKLRFHGKEVQYQCETCGKYFPNTVLFQDHLKIHLNRTARSYPCDMCARIFSSKVSLQGHKDRHKGYKRYLCDVCGMGFVTPQNFRQHKFTHEDHRPYKCKLCKFSAAQKISLHTHTKLHLKPKANLDPMRYRRNVMIPCEVCDEKFSCITSLKKHKTSVHGEKYYKCEHCGYSTGWQANYIKHLKVHSGVRPYVCHICDYSSVFRNNLKRHMKTHGNTLSSNLFSV